MLRRWAGLVVAAVAFGVVVPIGTATGAGATTIADPAQNIPESPSYWPTCTQQGTSSQACDDAVVAAIDNARSLEGVGPMTLPAGFVSMSPAEQTFVVSNLERVDRGLPPVAGMVDTLNTLASTAASNDADPLLPGWTVGPFQVDGWSSIWAGDLNALAADYDWMYDDGWGPTGSYNLDCTSATAEGCWGHRNAILRSGSNLITGVGSEQQSSWMSIAQIFVSGAGSYPAFTTSWSDITGDASSTDSGDGSTGKTTPPPTTTVKLQPTVTAWASVHQTGRTIVATVNPAEGQRVRLRRHTTAGWRTVAHAAAANWMTFNNVRRGHYRVVVAETTDTTRVVKDLRVS